MQKWAKEYVEKMKITLPAYDAWKAGPLKEWEETLNKEVQGTTYRAMLEACFEWVNTNQKPCLENESMKELAVLIPIAEKVVADAEPLIAPFSEHRPGDIVVSEVCEPWGALPIMINNFNKIIAMVRDGEVNFGATTSPQNIDKCVDQIREYVKNYKEP